MCGRCGAASPLRVTRVGYTSVSATVQFMRGVPLSGGQELASLGELVMVSVDEKLRSGRDREAESFADMRRK